MENKESRTFEINPKIEMKKSTFYKPLRHYTGRRFIFADNYENKKNPAVMLQDPLAQ